MWALMDGGAAGQHHFSSNWSSDYRAPTSTTDNGRLPLHKTPPRPGPGRRLNSAPVHADTKMESMTRISSMLETGTRPFHRHTYLCGQPAALTPAPPKQPAT